MKKIKIVVLILALVCALSMALTGCSLSNGNNPQTPQDVIKDAYGNKHFKISFSVTGLETPLEDLYYSANDIPKLPTPERVGYRFAGWYFDTAYTKPYDGNSQYNSLYLYMSDVTLYAKWEKEELVQNGIYELEYSAEIQEDTIAKGLNADKYGWLKFTDDIIASETYIEKNDAGVFLRIQYEMHYPCPTIDDNGNPGILTYAVTDINNRISDTQSIIDRTGTVQTIYYDIHGLDIAKPITLHVEFYNWGAELAQGESRDATKVGYDITFQITRFIGLTKGFVDISEKLQDGAYLVKTHYVSLSKNFAIMDSFNPVYSYIVANGGNYKLYKPMNVYNSDILGNLNEEDYINRRTGVFNVLAYYTIDSNLALTDEEANESYGTFYMPARLNGGKFGTLTYEFHADSGQYFMIMDLGDSLDKDLVLYGANTGAMAEMFNLGPTPHRLSIGYGDMVKLADWKYEELSGDGYCVTDNYVHYQGNYSDLEGNAAYDTLESKKYVNSMISYFYSSYDGASVRSLYSTRVTITPTSATSLYPTAAAEGKIGYFDMTARVFGYEAKSGLGLYSDGLSWYSLAGLSYAQRVTEKVSVGQTAAVGERVDLGVAYRKFINPSVNVSNLSYEAYALKSNGDADFGRPLSLSISNNSFVFEQNTAVLYKENVDGVMTTALIYFRIEEKPTVSVTDDFADWTYSAEKGVYVSNRIYTLDERADIPVITFTRYGKTVSTHDYYNEEDIDHAQPLLNNLRLALFEVKNGVYTHKPLNFQHREDNGFTMTADTMRLICFFTDGLGNVNRIELEYSGKEAEVYNICDGDGKVYDFGNPVYDKLTGVRNPISVIYNELDVISDVSEVNQILSRKFYFELGESRTEIQPTGYEIYSRKNTVKVEFGSADYNVKLTNTLADLKDEYALIIFRYSSGEDKFVKNYVYNIKITGKSPEKYQVIPLCDRFTDREYRTTAPMIMTQDGTVLANGDVRFYRYVGDMTLSANSKDILSYTKDSFSAKMTGKYKISYTIYFNLVDEYGEKVLLDGKSGREFQCTLSQDFEMYDSTDDYTVTYVTDSAHPFRNDLAGVQNNGDGTQSYTVTYSPSVANLSIDYTLFEASADRLYEWNYKVNQSYSSQCRAGERLGTPQFIQNSRTPVLYAVWDEGLTVTAIYEIDGQEKEIATKKVYKSVGRYFMNFSDFVFAIPAGYQMVGWESDKAIFYEGYGSDRIYYFDTLKLLEANEIFNQGFEIDHSVKIRAILKAPFTVSYAVQYDNSDESIDLGFPPDTVIEDSLWQDSVASNKRRRVQNAANAKGTVLYWAVKVNGELKEIDLESDVFKKEYAVNNQITLIAVIKSEEA